MATTKKRTTKKKTVKTKRTTKAKAVKTAKGKSKPKAAKKDSVVTAIDKIQGVRGSREKEIYKRARMIYVTSPEYITVVQVAKHLDLPEKYLQNKATEQSWTVQREIAQRTASQEAINKAYEDLVAFKHESIERLLWLIEEAEHDMVLHISKARDKARETGVPFRLQHIFGEDNARAASYILLRAQQQLISLTKAEEGGTKIPEGALIVIGDDLAKEVGDLAEAHPTTA